MTQLVMGFGTSHSPTIVAPPEMWKGLAKDDEHRPGIPFEKYKAERASWIDKELTPEKFQERHQANLKGLATLAETMAKVAPDVVLLVGDDQHELLWEDNYPPIAVYWGDTIPVVGAKDGALASIGPMSALAYHPDEARTYHGHPELGRHIIES